MVFITVVTGAYKPTYLGGLTLQSFCRFSVQTKHQSHRTEDPDSSSGKDGQRSTFVPGLVVHYGIPKSIEPLGSAGDVKNHQSNRPERRWSFINSFVYVQLWLIIIRSWIFHINCGFPMICIFRISMGFQQVRGYQVPSRQELHPRNRTLCPRRPAWQVCGAGVAQGGLLMWRTLVTVPKATWGVGPLVFDGEVGIDLYKLLTIVVMGWTKTKLITGGRVVMMLTIRNGGLAKRLWT